MAKPFEPKCVVVINDGWGPEMSYGKWKRLVSVERRIADNVPSRRWFKRMNMLGARLGRRKQSVPAYRRAWCGEAYLFDKD